MLFRRGKSYSQDLRERVFAAADDGERVVRIAAMLHVSVSYVSKVLSRRRLTGEETARPQCCHVVPKLSGLHPPPLLTNPLIFVDLGIGPIRPVFVDAPPGEQLERRDGWSGSWVRAS